jgi:hypothetical protein
VRAPVLCVRVSRRAIAGAVLEDERLSFFDGRHIGSRRDAALRAASRYAGVLLDQARPASAIIDCPVSDGSATTAVLDVIKRVLTEAGVEVHDAANREIVRAFGAVATRREMRAVAEPLFPELATVASAAKPEMIDAAACALFAESATGLGEAGG